MKTCGKCRKTLPESAYCKAHTQYRKIQGWCRGCHREYDRERRRANPESARQNDKRKRTKGTTGRLLSMAKSRAKIYSMEFSITKTDISIPSRCPVLGIPILVGASAHDRENAPSLDRIDPTRGYVSGNVRVISWRANRLKNDATAAELALLLQDAQATLGIGGGC